MQSFEVDERETEPVKLSTKLALLAGGLLVMVAVALLALKGQYVDVEQAVQVTETAPTSVAIHDNKTSR